MFGAVLGADVDDAVGDVAGAPDGGVCTGDVDGAASAG